VLAAAAVDRAGGRTASLTASTMVAFSGGWEGTGTCGDDGNMNRGCLSSPGLATSEAHRSAGHFLAHLCVLISGGGQNRNGRARKLRLR
jgi:hypothetical protein